MWLGPESALRAVQAVQKCFVGEFSPMDQELKLWIGGAVLTVVLAVVGTGVAVTTLVIGNVNTQISDVRADMRQIRDSVRDVRSTVQDVDDRIDATSSGINAVNTTLLFLTGCIVELEDRQLSISRGDWEVGDWIADLDARIDLPESCRTAHTRALEAAQ